MSKKILIFLSIALFLYLFDWFLNNDNENMIYVSDNDIDFLVATWNDQMQRSPSEEELKTIEKKIDKEISESVKNAIEAPEPPSEELTKYIWAGD